MKDSKETFATRKYRQALLSWYAHNKRSLPFRKAKNPYHIWVSEVMLQQTRVAAMLDSYTAFIKRFPNIDSLAKASEEEVVRYWKGLGYYSRALNLRKGAIQVLSQYNGKFPKTLAEALKIPGVGPYTARAVLSIAYDIPVAVLDGNVKRVLSRLFAYPKAINASSSQKELQELADYALAEQSPGDYNQAIMELGALVCVPNPNCLLCPVRSYCKALANDVPTNFPKQTEKKNKKNIILTFYFLQQGNSVVVTKDKQRKFFKTIYSLPFATSDAKSREIPSYLQKVLASKKQKKLLVNDIKHGITNHKIRVEAYRIIFSNRDRKLLQDLDCKWVSLENLEEEFPSSIAKKLMKYAA
ncbi:MAG: A/G-specific adenine glycosylase [Spirochaetota bacterium]